MPEHSSLNNPCSPIINTPSLYMKERPILFSGSMVRAILEDRKTQTRRVLKLPEDARQVQYWTTPSGRSQKGYADPGVNYWTPSGNHIVPCPYGQPGDYLWVRETFATHTKAGGYDTVITQYRADAETDEIFSTYGGECVPVDYYAWRPSIHMPRSESRITLLIKTVRVERLQDISTDDAIAEGVDLGHCSGCGACAGSDCCDPREAFMHLWNSINGKRPSCSWQENPWGCVIEFSRING